MDYQEFPKSLSHPGYKPARRIAEAIPGGPGAPNLGFGQPEQWEPEKWPPVTVNTADDEAYYVSRGYVPAGKSDPAAFSTAHASPYVAGRTVSEWPKMVNGVLTQDPNAPVAPGFQKYPMWMTPPDGGEAIFVSTAAEEEALLTQWTDPNAPGPREAVASDFEMAPGNSEPDDQEGDEEDDLIRSSPSSTLKLKKSEQRAAR